MGSAPATQDAPWFDMHVGRSWVGHSLEDDCPCQQQLCGLVAMDDIHDECPQHSFHAAQTIRQTHAAADCPARPVGRAD